MKFQLVLFWQALLLDVAAPAFIGPECLKVFRFLYEREAIGACLRILELCTIIRSISDDATENSCVDLVNDCAKLTINYQN